RLTRRLPPVQECSGGKWLSDDHRNSTGSRPRDHRVERCCSTQVERNLQATDPFNVKSGQRVFVRPGGDAPTPDLTSLAQQVEDLWHPVLNQNLGRRAVEEQCVDVVGPQSAKTRDDCLLNVLRRIEPPCSDRSPKADSSLRQTSMTRGRIPPCSRCRVHEGRRRLEESALGCDDDCSPPAPKSLPEEPFASATPINVCRVEKGDSEIERESNSGRRGGIGPSLPEGGP